MAIALPCTIVGQRIGKTVARLATECKINAKYDSGNRFRSLNPVLEVAPPLNGIYRPESTPVGFFVMQVKCS